MIDPWPRLHHATPIAFFSGPVKEDRCSPSLFPLPPPTPLIAVQYRNIPLSLAAPSSFLCGGRVLPTVLPPREETVFLSLQRFSLSIYSIFLFPLLLGPKCFPPQPWKYYYPFLLLFFIISPPEPRESPSGSHFFLRGTFSGLRMRGTSGKRSDFSKSFFFCGAWSAVPLVPDHMIRKCI